MRAELLVLRKWPAAWGLLLVLPVVTLLSYYVVPYVEYVTETPAQYATLGTPSQILPAMLPSQFVIIALTQFDGAGVVMFAVLGAALAGGDWGRGTIGTALLTGTGRVRTGIAQALALAVAVTASVVATFAVSAAASLVIRELEARVANPVVAAFPTGWIVVRGLGVGLLIAVTYGALGLALGTVFRSAAAGIAAALVWTALLEPTVFDLTSQAQGAWTWVAGFLPATSAATATSLFGSPGGGAGSSMWLFVRPAVAGLALAGYAAAFGGLALILLRRRDIAARPDRRRRVRAPRPPRPAPALVPVTGPLGGVLASLRAELMVMRHRPAVWALVLATPVTVLIGEYLTGYVYYQTATTGLSADVSGPLVLTSLLPGQYLTSALSGLGTYSGLYGPAVFFLLGALIAGTDWGRGTVRTALLQGPGRLATRIGQDLAVLTAAVVAIALTFGVAAAASAVAAGVDGSALPYASGFPVPAHVVASVAGGVAIVLACTAVGLAAGTVLRSATKAVAAVLLWTVIVQPYLDQIGPQLRGVLLRVYEVLPDASINTLVNLYNTTADSGAGTLVQPPYGVLITPAFAFAVLAAYLLAALAAAGWVTRRRTLI
jgi:ABC-2 type transport system permease protein